MKQDEPVIYEICVEGQLDARWSDWFDGMTICNREDGSTILRGPCVDQSALFGVLTKIHTLNLTLISVERHLSYDMTSVT